MADKDSNELIVASYGTIWTAPVGTALPVQGDDPAASLNAAFLDLGYVTEDGVKFTSTPSITDIAAWQSLDPVRRLRTGRETMMSFSLLQWDGDNVSFAFGGGDIVDHSGGIYSFTPPAADDSLAEVSLIVDWVDGTEKYRLVVPRGNVTEATDTQLQRSAAATLPIGFKALAPSGNADVWYLLTNDHSFAAGS